MKKLHKSEGDINISARRQAWQRTHIDADSRALLDEDARYFLKQSLSTPCLNIMRACEGIYIEDLQGRRYMDFHGNNVHQVGFSNPDVIAAIKISDLVIFTRITEICVICAHFMSLLALYLNRPSRLD